MDKVYDGFNELINFKISRFIGGNPNENGNF